MNYKEIQELLRLITKLELSEFKMKDGEFELTVRTKDYSKVHTTQITQLPAPMISAQPSLSAATFTPPAPTTTTPPPTQPDTVEQQLPTTAPAENATNYLPIKSPIVGTFYRSPSPDKPAYVKVGDRIEKGSVVCIVEAMKLFNEIESEVTGKVVKVLVEDAQPVEYDQVLFLVDPKG